MKLVVTALVAAFGVAGACSLSWAQPASGGGTAAPAARLAKKCKDLATRQERADCTRLARERRTGMQQAGHPRRAASGTRDRMAVGAASAPLGGSSAPIDARTAP